MGIEHGARRFCVRTAAKDVYSTQIASNTKSTWIDSAASTIDSGTSSLIVLLVLLIVVLVACAARHCVSVPAVHEAVPRRM